MKRPLDRVQVSEQTAMALIRSAAVSLPKTEAQAEIDRIVKSAAGPRPVTGTVHTPPSGAALMCRMALDALGNGLSDTLRVLDPACGSGVFLVQMLRMLSRLTGQDRRLISVNNLAGIDISPVAVEGTRHAIALEVGDTTLVEQLQRSVVRLDSLLDEPGEADIVIGNPPYVRSHNLPPKYRRAIVRKLTDYYSQADLARIRASSDLYVYFMLRSLSLLREGGVLCLLVPNAWLDTVYGAGMRSVLGEAARIVGVYDFAETRVFSDASVNAVVLVAERGKPDSAALTRFVSLSADTDAENYREIQGVTVKQSEAFSRAGAPGVLLRATDIYRVVRRKAREKIVNLGELARVRRGMTTGANWFFYPSPQDIDEFAIEAEFLYPAIRSPKDCRRIVVSSPSGKVFVCRKPREVLKGTGALRYIDWGEKNGLPARPSLAARRYWWWAPDAGTPDLAWVKSVDKTHRQCRLARPVLIDQRLYGVYCSDSRRLNLVMNTAVAYLLRETHGRTALGDGALDSAVVDVRSLPVPSPELVPAEAVESIEDLLSSRDILPVSEELLMPDRLELDRLVSSAMGLTTGEAEGVCEEVVRLVDRRMERARSAAISDP